MKFYTETEYLQKRVETLEEQLAEKDAMIDWLVSQLQKRCNRRKICSACLDYIEEGGYFACHNNNWRKAAQEAVRENESQNKD